MSQWSLVRYERGEVKLLCHGAGSQLLPARKQSGSPEGKPVAQSALSLATETSLPLAFSISTSQAGFVQTWQDAVSKPVGLILLPQKSLIHTMTSVVQNKHIWFARCGLFYIQGFLLEPITILSKYWLWEKCTEPAANAVKVKSFCPIPCRNSRTSFPHSAPGTWASS